MATNWPANPLFQPFHGQKRLDGDVLPIKSLPGMIARYVSRLGVETQREFLAQFAMEAIGNSPRGSSGLFAASWTISVGEPAFRGLSPGQAFPVMTRAALDAIAEGLDGTKPGFLTNDAIGRGKKGDSYAWVIDRGRMPYVTRKGMGGSTQAPLGVSNSAAFRAQRQTEARRAQIEEAAR